jgi:23S rRNA pseudouridine1911/1915/1917 synthase
MSARTRSRSGSPSSGSTPPVGAPPVGRPPAREEDFDVTDADAGQRLDVVVAKHLPAISRSEIQRLIRAGHITVSRGKARSGTALSPGLRVHVVVPAPRAATPAAEDLPLSLLYDDEDVVVIDKPPGMVVHPAAGHRHGTLVNALLHHVGGLSGIGGEERPGIVHRLDRGTSGVMVVAKHDRAHRDLARQFHDRLVAKEYVALVWGRPASRLRFDRPIGRDPRNRQRMSTRARRARGAVTEVISVEPLGAVSLVRLTIGTGRTHQIRVHLSDAGYAVVGDAVYGGKRGRAGGPGALARLNRPFLHASKITFTHPTGGQRMTVEAPLAPDLADILARLRQEHR